MVEPSLFNDFSERRQFPRKPIMLNLSFKVQRKGTLLHSQKVVQTRNISASGLALYSELELAPSDEMTMTLYLPPKEKRQGDLSQVTWQDSQAVSVILQGRVVWQMPFIGSKYAYGVEFTSITKDSKAAFQEFLRDFEMHIPNFAR